VQDAAFRDRAVHLADADALVLADLHVGRAEASDVEFPLGEGSALRERLDTLLSAFDPGEVVFAGDVLHDFAQATVAAERSVDALVAACREAGSEAVLVRGNHDPMLPEVWDGPLHDEYRLADGTVVCHGHEEPDARGERYVVGHDHPTVNIEGRRHPCYLLGPAAYRGEDFLMLPAFTRLAAGVEVNDMTAANFHSPLVTDADALRPVVHDRDSDEVLRFPPLGRFRSML
jgi:putative SbcD/Mre11-related phosphoesterase